jgi:hypothetical protein
MLSVEGLFDTTRGVHVVRVDDPGQLQAEARAVALVERAQLNEAINVVQSLMDEVRTMTISSRFNPALQPNKSYFVTTPLSHMFRGLNEPEYKRQTILMALNRIINEITSTVSKLDAIVMDIEATKAE